CVFRGQSLYQQRTQKTRENITSTSTAQTGITAGIEMTVAIRKSTDTPGSFQDDSTIELPSEISGCLQPVSLDFSYACIQQASCFCRMRGKDGWCFARLECAAQFRSCAIRLSASASSTRGRQVCNARSRQMQAAISLPRPGPMTSPSRKSGLKKSEGERSISSG
ncbi:MAG: hypothetical protein UZ02_AOB001001842, partial [Nitrosomonas europaea]